MYEDRYSLDWDDLDRDEALERAYALGVAAELGEDHPEEYARLVAAVGRPLAQMAYDEGQTAATELRRDAGGRSRDETTAPDVPDRDHEIWSRLVDHGEDEGEQTNPDRSAGPTRRSEVPELLRRFDPSGHPATEDGRSRLDLPDVLFR